MIINTWLIVVNNLIYKVIFNQKKQMKFDITKCITIFKYFLPKP